MVTPPLRSAILFDVDGPLIDSNGAHARAWWEALREIHHAAELDSLREMIGMGSDKLLPAIGLEPDSILGRQVARRKKEIFATLLPSLSATAGARSLLAWLREKDVTMVIATSGDDQEVAALTKQAGIGDLIPIRTSKDDAPQSKPDPDIVQAALRKAGVRAADAVLVGDTPYDVEAARNAGVDAIALRSGGYWPDAAFADAVGIVDDPAALLRLWKQAK